jgi:hypothetical protein
MAEIPFVLRAVFPSSSFEMETLQGSPMYCDSAWLFLMMGLLLCAPTILPSAQQRVWRSMQSCNRCLSALYRPPAARVLRHHAEGATSLVEIRAS